MSLKLLSNNSNMYHNSKLNNDRYNKLRSNCNSSPNTKSHQKCNPQDIRGQCLYYNKEWNLILKSRGSLRRPPQILLIYLFLRKFSISRNMNETA